MSRVTLKYLTSFTGMSLSERGMNLGSRPGRVGKKKGASLGCLGGSIGLLRSYKQEPTSIVYPPLVSTPHTQPPPPPPPTHPDGIKKLQVVPARLGESRKG